MKIACCENYLYFSGNGDATPSVFVVTSPPAHQNCGGGVAETHPSSSIRSEVLVTTLGSRQARSSQGSRIQSKVCLSPCPPQTCKKSKGKRVWLTVGRTGLALAVIAVVVARDQWGIDVNAVRDSLAETVSGENHSDGFLWGSFERFWEVFGMKRSADMLFEIG